MRAWMSLFLFTITFLGGCGAKGYKITPIAATEVLKETIVAGDKGIMLPKIVVIDIEGAISNTRESSLLGSGENKMALIVEKINRACADPKVKAVVLRINSPGGTVTASDILYREIVKLSRKKPVVTSMMDVAASGGYYIACATDEIIAEPTTITGSIGVIMQTYNVKNLLGKIGVMTDAIKSGSNKDAGSPFRFMTPEERKIFQSIIDEFYENFLAVVCQSRSQLSEADIRSLADGRVYTGKQALALGLVDQLGGLSDAIKSAKCRAELKKAKVVMYHRPAGYRGSIYSVAQPTKPNMNQSGSVNLNINAPEIMQQQGSFLYLWQP